MKHKNLLGTLLIVFIVLAGCAVTIEKPPVPVTKLSVSDYPVFDDDLDIETLEIAIGKSLEYYDRLPEDRVFYFGTHAFTAGALKESLVEFAEIMKTSESAAVRNRRIRESFDVYRAVGNDGKGTVLFTGYYAPILKGSLTRDETYRYPIYRTPQDHIMIDLEMFHSKFRGERLIARYEDGEIIPYYTREEIDARGALEGKGLEIAWFSDYVDLFFLHIQGSGIIQLKDGRLIKVSYDRSNGHPYRSIGRYLVDQGKMPLAEISLKSIKRYLNENPEELSQVLNYNKSYVFFRIVQEGPVGSLNVPVTSGRTIATDSTLFPKGSLAFIRTKKPTVDENGHIMSWVSFSRFVLNQDTGGAIKGPGRVDLFCGSGMYAEAMAGHLKETGDLYFLVKRHPGR